MNERRVLVVGLGISGIATAIHLHNLGWKPLIIERAKERRTGGYTIVLFGTGKVSADRLGVLGTVVNRLHPEARTYEVDRVNRRHTGMSLAEMPGEPRPMLRGDLEHALFSALPRDVEVRFSTVPTRIEQDPLGVHVTLTDTRTGAITTERFDLVVGADGMRSTVRKLVFGPHEQFLLPLKYMIGACMLSRPVDGLAPHDGLVLAEAGRSAWVFGLANHNPTVLFSYRTEDVDAQLRRPPIESLRAAFGPGPAGPVLGQLLDEFERASGSLFDSANQVRMDRWSRGRVVLVGDSAWCPTLYSGMGASMGLAGSELLSSMLEAFPDDIERALSAWEEKLRPFATSVQLDALKMRQIFTPAGELERLLRATFLRLVANPIMGSFARRLIDNDDLKTLDIVTR